MGHKLGDVKRLPVLTKARTRRRKKYDYLGLLILIILCLAVLGIGGAVTALSVETWYPTLAKPPFNPPDWVFAPVWTALYILMAVAAWLIWCGERSPDRAVALTAFGVQLGLNLLWSVIFFGFRLIGPALVEIALLLAAIIATTILFWRIDRLAGALFVPYIAWVSYAAILNAALWRLN